MTGSGVDLHSGDVFRVHMTYDGANLAMTITDAATSGSFSITWPINIPSTIGGANTAYAGFTASTGGFVANQNILSWTMTSGSGGGGGTVATPTFSPAAGTYLGTQTVTLGDTTSGATIFYTVDGSQPGTTAGGSTKQYSGALDGKLDRDHQSPGNCLGTTSSGTASATYTIESQVATPTFTPAGGSYTSAQTVSISTTTPAPTTIYYTTNGSTPTNQFSRIQGLSVAGDETLKAYATKSGYFDSNVATAAYMISSGGTSVATPTFSPAGGTYLGTQTVTLSDATAGSTIYYTLDGTQPGTSASGSTLQYSGPLSITSTTTVKALATASGQTTSATATATYTIETQVATPTFTPAAGTYSSTVNVTIASTTAGATIYYTTNGTAPTNVSTLYTGPVAVSSSETLKAIATKSGYFDSNVGTAAYTISTGGGGGTSINFPNGFTTGSVVLNGNAAITGTNLALTDTVNTFEVSSAWYPTAVNIQNFTTDFSFQDSAGTPTADGMTFTIQGNSTAALGASGGNLGYATTIGKSVAVKFDLYSNSGEGADSTGLYLNGASPTIPAVDMTGSGIDLHSGDVFKVHMSYDGTNLAMTITDATTNATFTHTWAVDIPGTVGGTTVFAGFTAGTGGYTANQQILNWTLTSGGATTVPPPKVTVQFEPESTAIFNASVSSGPTYRIFAYSGFTDGQGTILDATAPGQRVSIPLNIPQAGVYDVKVGTKATTTRGISQLSINGANVGPAEDQYAPSETFKQFDLGTVSLPAGNVTLVFTVTAKNAASTGYTEAFDYITITQQ